MMNQPRYLFYDDNGNFFVEIKTQKNIWLIIFVLFYFGLKLPHTIHRFDKIVQAELTHPNSDLMVLFVYGLGFLLASSIVLAGVWLAWSLFGREIISIERGLALLKIQYRIGSLKLVRTYRLNQIGNIHPASVHNPMSSILKGGNIAFEYEGKTRRFGWTLAEEDAKEICSELKKYLPEQAHSLIR